MTKPIKIHECSRCQAPQVFKPSSMDSEIPVVLYLNMDGGYGNFIDNFMNDPAYNLMLCHKCGHEFANWIGINLTNGHPKEEEEYCNGWSWEDAIRKQEEYLASQFKKYFPNT